MIGGCMQVEIIPFRDTHLEEAAELLALRTTRSSQLWINQPWRHGLPLALARSMPTEYAKQLQFPLLQLPLIHLWRFAVLCLLIWMPPSNWMISSRATSPVRLCTHRSG